MFGMSQPISPFEICLIPWEILNICLKIKTDSSILERLTDISGNYVCGVEDKVDYVRLDNLKLSSPITENILSEMFSSRVLL